MKNEEETIMKKLITVVLILALLIPAAALADLPDISGLSFDELAQLIRTAKWALWACPEWKEVEVPAGVYKIGEDIPAGRWSIQVSSGDYSYYAYGSKTDRTGTKIDDDYCEVFGSISGDASDHSLHQLDITFEDGFYFEIHKTCYFYPCVKKLDFNFR